MLFGLIGKSLGHSFSKKYFSEKFTRESLQATYQNFELQSIGEFKKLVADHDFSGLNVTIPYKRDIINYLDEVNPEALEIGAVNTIVFTEGRIKGYNTDHIGFSESIDLSTVNKALVLGNGGAHHAIVFALKKSNITVDVLARNPFGKEILWSNNGPSLSEYDLVVNTTPLGTYPNVDELLPLQYQTITSGSIFYDLVYNPENTAFMRKAQQHGALVKNGFEMLKGQAEAAFKLWTSH